MATPKTGTENTREKPAPRKNSKADTFSNTQEIFSQLFSTEETEEAVAGTLLLVDLERVLPRKEQPRTFFDTEALGELSRDIQELRSRGGGVAGSGILQPLLVDADDAGTFRIVAGERRFRAARQAGCATIPVIVRESMESSGSLAEWWEDALRENIQRQDLTPLEEARALARMAEEGGYSVRVLAERLGKGKGYVEHRLALAKAGVDVQELVSRRRDTLSIAREIDKVSEPQWRKKLIERALEGASVTDLRAAIENPNLLIGGQVKTKSNRSAPNDDAKWDSQLKKLDEAALVSIAIKALDMVIGRPVDSAVNQNLQAGLEILSAKISALREAR